MRVRLVNLDQPPLGHLEDGHERDHEVVDRDVLFEEVLEPDLAPLPKHIGELAHAVLDADALRRDLERQVRLRALEHRVEGVEELEQARARERRWPARAGRLRSAPEDVSPRDGTRAQLLGRDLVLLVLQEAPDELGARVDLVLRLLVVLVVRLLRQEHLALDVGQRRGHHEVLARDVQIELLHQRDVLEVALRHEGDREVQDVQLVLPDQMQEQIERPLEVRQRDLEVGIQGLEGRLGHRARSRCDRGDRGRRGGACYTRQTSASKATIASCPAAPRSSACSSPPAVRPRFPMPAATPPRSAPGQGRWRWAAAAPGCAPCPLPGASCPSSWARRAAFMSWSGPGCAVSIWTW